MSELRCYHFHHWYLGGAQIGIQSAHAQSRLFAKYRQESDQKTMLYDWVDNHETMIVLNGGGSSNMHNTWNNVIDNKDNPYPYAKFNESPEAVEGLLTNISIILPEEIYNSAAILRSGGKLSTRFSSFDYMLINVLKSSKLMG